MKGFGEQNNKKKKKIKYSSSHKDKIINLALNLHSKGKISEAVKYYQFCFNQGFNDHRILSNYGIILQNQGKLIEAESFIRKAIEIKPDFSEAYSNLGNILKELGKLKDAEISYRRAVQLNPNFINAHLNLGNILRELGKLKDAEISFRKAIEINPYFTEAHSNLGNILRDLGNLKDAEISARKAIEIKPDFTEAHSNLGIILRELGKLKDAEISFRKAIEIKPDFSEAHLNLGKILRDLGKLKDAEISFRKSVQLNPSDGKAHLNLGNLLRDLGNLNDAELFIRKAIEINPDLALAYFSLSILKYSNENEIWKDKLFSENILKNKSNKEKVDIYFARTNILHKEKKYKESSRYLKLANELKLDLKPFRYEDRINKSRKLLIEADKKEINKKEYKNCPESIFIVGMPRCGSTLLESILSINNDVYDLGEINILEESFLEHKKIDKKQTLTEIYWEKISSYKSELSITTNKWLYNYQYAGIISNQISNAKIIHCFRNPLDNILSIYRANFAYGNQYSSSLVDCARIYLDQDEIMCKYKKRFRSKIYDLNYDLLVSNPKKEIKSLISWLGWKWTDSYLSPHLNPRSVSTASTVQVRSPINSKSVGGWENYKDILEPCIEILTENDKYKNLVK